MTRTAAQTGAAAPSIERPGRPGPLVEGVRLWHFIVVPATAMGLLILISRALDHLLPDLAGTPYETVYHVLRTAVIAVVMASVVAWLALRHRREYEERLLARQRALETTRDFLSSIIQGSGEAIVTLDAERRVTSWNRAAEEIYGWSAAEIVGRNIDEILPPDAESRRELDRTEEELRRGLTVRDFETRRVHRDGRPICVRITRSPLFDGEGRYMGSTGIVRDVTAIKEMEARLLERECLAAVGEMAAQVAHEIRNPLMGIRGACEILCADYPEKHPRREMAREAVLQADRLNRTVEDLLRFGRPRPMESVPCDLHQVLDRVLGALKEDPRAREVSFERKYARDLPVLRLDPLQMEQVIFNLLINAFQAMEHRGGLVIETEDTEGEVVLRIRDTGPGIPEQAMAQIFKPFYTTRSQGTGLGLAIVRSIVLAHGGTISAANVPGGGAEFTIGLPKRS